MNVWHCSSRENKQKQDNIFIWWFFVIIVFSFNVRENVLHNTIVADKISDILITITQILFTYRFFLYHWTFIGHLSWSLKGGNFYTFCKKSVCVRYFFKTFSKNNSVNCNHTMYKAFFGKKIYNSLDGRHALLQREIINNVFKKLYLKTIFAKTVR